MSQRRLVGLSSCLLFLWPCLSALTGKAIEDVESSIVLAKPLDQDAVIPVAVLVTSDSDNPNWNLISVIESRDSAVPTKVIDLKLYTNNPRVSAVPPVLGKFERIGDEGKFKPAFGLQSGLEYFVQLSYENKDEKDWLSFRLPGKTRIPEATVSAVYPSRSELPENLLKFYIHFSHPMSRGNVYDFIHLIDDQGKVVELPFLELGEELWDYNNERLTLLFDPGRIKTGLVPNIQEGLALYVGRDYTLKIDADWPDAQGQPMVEGFEKTFTVTVGDTISPNPYNWKKTWPKAGTKEPIVLEFPESLDEALLQRVLVVLNRFGQAMNGTVSIGNQEKRWEFIPAVDWQAGDYRLEIKTILEDVAGNSIARPFELEMQQSENYRAGPEVVHLDFQIQ